MNYSPYILVEKKQILPDTWCYWLQPQGEETMFSFLPGQYCFIKNPSFPIPDEAHPFSIASSPTQKDRLEFCIKVYGDWTEHMTQSQKGDIFLLSEPEGTFVWDSQSNNPVFLLGGIGISPIMSMLRYIAATKNYPTSITLIYGNRTPETVVYREELTALSQQIPLRTVNVYSHLEPQHPWNGYRGFITKELLEKEVTFSHHHTFFLVGPPIFVEKMKELLTTFRVNEKDIICEQLEKK